MPGARAAFLIGTVELEVSAVSEGAERLLGGDERTLLGSSALDVLTSPFGHDKLARAVRGAAMRAREPEVMPVRSTAALARSAGTLAARISTGGPPRAWRPRNEASAGAPAACSSPRRPSPSGRRRPAGPVRRRS